LRAAYRFPFGPSYWVRQAYLRPRSGTVPVKGPTTLPSTGHLNCRKLAQGSRSRSNQPVKEACVTRCPISPLTSGLGFSAARVKIKLLCAVSPDNGFAAARRVARIAYDAMVNHSVSERIRFLFEAVVSLCHGLVCTSSGSCWERVGCPAGACIVSSSRFFVSDSTA